LSFIILLFFQIGDFSFAQQDSSDNSIVNEDSLAHHFHYAKLNHKSFHIDSSDVEIRSVDSAKIKSYLKDKHFIYLDDPKATMTLWEKLMEWINRQFQKFFYSKAGLTTMDIISYLLAAFAIIAIIIGLIKSDIRGLFFPSRKKKNLDSSESLEDIYTIDYENLIADAIANSNYRYAIRLNYLRTLKKLSDKEIINWRIDKTNREFVKEIKANKLKSKFETMTLNFENIWYGGFAIDLEGYSELQKNYAEFNSVLDADNL
jgi:hypothetical protein